MTEKTKAHPERRHSRERRANLLPHFTYWGRRGRRCQVRRQQDLTGVYLDQYPAPLFWSVVAILALCFMDAIFTLSLLQRGAVELNPFMAVLINTSVPLFSGVKMAVTGLALVWLIIHHNFRVLRIFRVQGLIYGFLLFYLALVMYEILLLAEPFSG